MKRPVIYTFLGLALFTAGVKVNKEMEKSSPEGPERALMFMAYYLSVHLGINLFVAGVGMAMEAPKLFLKNPDTGMLAFNAQVFWWPLILLNKAILSMYRKANSSKTPVIQRIHDKGLWVGGYPSGPEYDALCRNLRKKEDVTLPTVCIDLTCDLPRLTDWEWYANFQTWDGYPPTEDEIQAAAVLAKKYTEAHKPVLVHCTFGVGRSTTVMCGILVWLGLFPDWQSAFEHIKSQRPAAKLSQKYRERLTVWQHVYIELPKAKKEKKTTPAEETKTNPTSEENASQPASELKKRNKSRKAE